MLHQLRGPSLLLLGALSISCGPKNFGLGESRDCEKGTINCVCDVGNHCIAPLQCQGDLCVPANGGTPGLSTHTSESTRTDDSSSSSSQNNETSAECNNDVECPAPDKPCYAATCQNGACFSEMLPDLSPCTDPGQCIAQGSCEQGVCKGKEARFLTEDFSQGKGKWRMESPIDQASIWNIGPAKASDCEDVGQGEDPANDHSPSEDNMIAGTKIGGCIQAKSSRKWDCLVSPKLDISTFKGKIEFSYWRHLHSPPDIVQGLKGAHYRVFAVFNGKTPVIVEEGYDHGINDTKWYRTSHLLDADDSSLTISFCFETGQGARYFAGWSLDDIRVRMQGCDAGL